MSDSPATLLAAVAELAQLAGARALAHFKQGLAVETKGDGSPVTAADRETERFAREWLAQRFPHDAIVGEEFGEGGRAGAPRQWLLDPIDGTHAFVHGVPLWGTLVAVAEGDVVLAGAIALPAAHELAAAARGEGAWWNGARCSVSNVAALADACVLTTGSDFGDRPDRLERWRTLAGEARLQRTWGDAFGYVLVASGRAEVMMDPRVFPWDVASVRVLIEEAGGAFCDWTGAATIRGQGAIVCNRALAPAVRAALVAPR